MKTNLYFCDADTGEEVEPEVELGVEYEPADPSVGIMSGGLCVYECSVVEGFEFRGKRYEKGSQISDNDTPELKDALHPNQKRFSRTVDEYLDDVANENCERPEDYADYD